MTNPNVPVPRKTAKRVKIDRTKKIYMTVEQWQAVPSNPAQPRDESIRARSPRAKHLWTFVPNVHDKVRMAQDSRGNRWKINAHTRSYIWSNGLSNVVPERIEVDIIPVSGVEEAKRHCREYEDSRDSVLTNSDVVHGALTEHGISMTSDFFKKSSGLASPLRYAWEVYTRQHTQALSVIRARVGQATFPSQAAADARDYVRLLKPALNALDKIDPKKMMCQGIGLFGGPLLTAYFLAYLKYGDDIMTFFERINEGRSTQKDNRMDPVAAARHYLMLRREKKEGAGRVEHMLVAATILGAVDSYIKTPNFDSRDKEGKSNCAPKVNLTRLQTIDLDVYFKQWDAKRTGRGRERNSTVRNK